MQFQRQEWEQFNACLGTCRSRQQGTEAYGLAGGVVLSSVRLCQLLLVCREPALELGSLVCKRLQALHFIRQPVNPIYGVRVAFLTGHGGSVPNRQL